MLSAILAKLAVVLLIVVVGGIVRGIRALAQNAAAERQGRQERMMKAAEQATSRTL